MLCSLNTNKTGFHQYSIYSQALLNVLISSTDNSDIWPQMSITINSWNLKFSNCGFLQIFNTNHTPNKNKPPSQRLCIITIIEKWVGNGVMKCAGGYIPISFAIDMGSSQVNPIKTPNQYKYQKYLLIFSNLYNRITITTINNAIVKSIQ